MSDKLSDALAKFNATMDHLGGCTDGGCVIKRPAGMHTNGGCRCPKDAMKMQRAMSVANGLRDAVSAFLGASPAPAIPILDEKAFAAWVRTQDGGVGIYDAYLHGTKAAPAISESEDARDAARYRWLRDVSVPPHNFYLSVPVEFDGVRYTRAEVDAAIDAAIDAARKGEKS